APIVVFELVCLFGFVSMEHTTLPFFDIVGKPRTGPTTLVLLTRVARTINAAEELAVMLAIFYFF
ncbi:hypothetical protein PJM26_31035, partial [Mycobacterium kansasii]